jgi:sterol desaturase/sphingolipid hydroxylase (fatty acid hydroxylase superfamily)
MYLTNCGFYQACDKYLWLQQYKLARKPYMEPSAALVWKTNRNAMFSQLILIPLIGYWFFGLFKYFGMYDLDDPLPSLQQMMAQFVIAHIFNDFGFYWSHRIGHTKFFYERVHKQHHEYSGTVGQSAEYAHFVEQIVSNHGPTVGGVLLLGTHPLCVLSWILCRLHQSYENHSGYCFEGSLLDRLWIAHPNASVHHDHHHTSNQGNFGVTMYTDWIWGTMDPYQAAGGYEGYVKRRRNSPRNRRE